MASLCMPQTHYQQQQQFIASNGMMMQQQLQQYAAAQQQQQQPKVLGTSNLQNIQPSASSFGPMATQKKKYTYLNMPYGEQLPSVARRNARERNRVKQVNNGFANLRQHLPQTVVNSLSNGGRGASKKLSKVDTLRIAVEYIRGLQDMLDGCDGGDTSATGTLLLDESSNDGSNYGYETRFPMAHSYNSEASASPTPSYSDSDISIGGANYLPPLSSTANNQQQQQSAVASNSAMQFKFEPFDSYNQFANDEEQADDEELLDYISSWQEQ